MSTLKMCETRAQLGPSLKVMTHVRDCSEQTSHRSHEIKSNCKRGYHTRLRLQHFHLNIGIVTTICSSHSPVFRPVSKLDQTTAKFANCVRICNFHNALHTQAWSPRSTQSLAIFASEFVLNMQFSRNSGEYGISALQNWQICLTMEYSVSHSCGTTMHIVHSKKPTISMLGYSMSFKHILSV